MLQNKMVLILPSHVEVPNEIVDDGWNFIKVDDLVRPSYIINGESDMSKILTTFNALMARIFDRMPVSTLPTFYRYARKEDRKHSLANIPSPKGGAAFLIIWDSLARKIKFSVSFCHPQVRFNYIEARKWAKLKLKSGDFYTIDNCDLNGVSSLDIILNAVTAELHGSRVLSAEFISKHPEKPAEDIHSELKRIQSYLFDRV